MANQKDNNTKEIEGEKSEKSENVVVHVDKDGADEIKKLKATLTTKKSTATRYINKLKKQATAFANAADVHNRDNTPATKTALKFAAENIVDSRSKLKKHHDELEKLAEEIKETLEQYSVTGADGEVTKLETEAYEYADNIEDTLVEHNVLISEAIVASKSEPTPTQRNSSAPAMITQQGELFRDVGSLKPSFLEKGANLMEVSHWIEQARNYIEAGFKDPPPNEGT